MCCVLTDFVGFLLFTYKYCDTLCTHAQNVLYIYFCGTCGGCLLHLGLEGCSQPRELWFSDFSCIRAISLPTFGLALP